MGGHAQDFIQDMTGAFLFSVMHVFQHKNICQPTLISDALDYIPPGMCVTHELDLGVARQNSSHGHCGGLLFPLNII